MARNAITIPVEFLRRMAAMRQAQINQDPQADALAKAVDDDLEVIDSVEQGLRLLTAPLRSRKTPVLSEWKQAQMARTKQRSKS